MPLVRQLMALHAAFFICILKCKTIFYTNNQIQYLTLLFSIFTTVNTFSALKKINSDQLSQI